MFENNCLYDLITSVERAGISARVEQFEASYKRLSYSQRKDFQKQIDAKKAEWYRNIKSLFEFTHLSEKWVYYKGLKMECFKWFIGNKDKINKVFIRQIYKTAANAFESTEHAEELAEAFMEWFEEKRQKFMKKMDDAIAEIHSNTLIAGKKPSAHGGVANLLKVLTRTMELQGADIKSIAKMQYGVCVQAGVYLPQEFLTDVAAALEVIE